MSFSLYCNSYSFIAFRYTGPKLFNEHPIAYLNITDREVYLNLLKSPEYSYLSNFCSFSSFVRYKPFWLKPAKWLTCQCPKCLEIKDLYATYTRAVRSWHLNDAKAGVFANPRPIKAQSLDGVADTYCWHCRLYNPLHNSLPSPPSIAEGGLDHLYAISVCANGVEFDAKSKPECANGLKSV